MSISALLQSIWTSNTRFNVRINKIAEKAREMGFERAGNMAIHRVLHSLQSTQGGVH